LFEDIEVSQEAEVKYGNIPPMDNYHMENVGTFNF
jgi:hypothetical protein